MLKINRRGKQGLRAQTYNSLLPCFLFFGYKLEPHDTNFLVRSEKLLFLLSPAKSSYDVDNVETMVSCQYKLVAIHMA